MQRLLLPLLLCVSSVLDLSEAFSSNSNFPSSLYNRNNAVLFDTQKNVAFYHPLLPLHTTASARRERNLHASNEKSSNGEEELESNDGPIEGAGDADFMFDIKTTFSLVAGQFALIIVAAVAAFALGTPNFGLGPNVNFSGNSLAIGTLFALPLGVLAYVLDSIEENFPALQDVTKATQRSVLALLGSTFKPALAVVIATALGIAAGLGEEMLFRGVLQYEIGNHWGDILAVAVASIVFGALHAVTPMYAFLASLASVYFGYLYLSSGNLAVPIATHTVYDIAALFYAHWEVSKLTDQEKLELAEWAGPMDPQ